MTTYPTVACEAREPLDGIRRLHCWHPTGEVKETPRKEVREGCCWCRALRWRTLWNAGEREHGPHVPGAALQSAEVG